MNYLRCTFALLFVFTTCFVVADELQPLSDVRTTQTILSAPLVFEKNIGQFDTEVKYLSRSTSGTSYFFTEQGVTILLSKNTTEHSGLTEEVNQIERDEIASHSLKISFVGANTHPIITPEEQAVSKVNYFKGKDPSKWKTGVSNFLRIRYHNIYDGIDLVYYGNGKQLEYDFVVHPGADPNSIRIHYEGSEEALALLENGSVAIRTSVGLLHEKKPFVYQMKEKKSEVVASWNQLNETDLQFSLGEYDRTKTLYIDPVIFSTFLGGSLDDQPFEIKIEQSGNIVITGYTRSSDFPLTIGAIDTTVVSSDAFICRMTPDGTQLLWSTFLGGSVGDVAGGLAIDQFGNFYISGTTSSPDFPVTPTAFDTILNGTNDAYIAKLNSNGDSIIFATFLGGNSGEQRIQNIAIDADGNSYITGGTSSTSGFPITPNAFDTSRVGTYSQNFVLKLNSTGTALIYGSYLGECSGYGVDIAVDPDGRSYSTGVANGTLPVTPDAIYPTFQGGGGEGDTYLAVISPNGDSVVYCTYLGGSLRDLGYGLRRNSRGEVFICGWTESPNYPVTPGAHDTSFYSDGNFDSFVTKFDSTLTTILWSTFIGNEGWQDAFTMDIDKDDNVYVAGRTTEGGILTTPDAFDSTFNGGENGDEFFVKYDPTGSVLLYGTYIGGFADDWCRTLIVDSTGDVYVVGRSPSSDFPTTPGAFDETYSGSYDVTITKLHLGSSVGSIEGLVFYDRNGNGQMDSSEYALQNWPLRLADTLNQQLQIVMTNTDGYFRFKVEAGSYKVSQIFNNDWEQSYPPARLNPQAILYDVNVNPGDSITGLNFGAHPLGDEPELDVYMYAGYPYPLREPCCGDSITYFIVYRNIGNVAVSNAKIEVTLDEQVLYSSVSSDPDIGAPRIDGKKIQWNNISLNAQSGNRKIVLYCKLDCVQPPSPQPGPQVISKVEIKPHGNDFKHKRTANCSHDPNDKRVQPAGCTAAGFISPADSLTYTIRFQNTGTAPAYRVIVRDTLDGDFDFSTVKPLGSSHASVFQRFGNELVWTFDPIELPDSSTDELGSQGFLTFQVKPPVGVPDGTVFENRAGIYFDRNAVVMTNTTVNTVTSSPLPVASFVVSAETVLAGSPVNFFYNGGNTGATYHWEFGYGAVQATSAEENPTGIIYLEEGEQLVSLNVGLGDCISEPAVQSIVVVAPHYATDRTMVNFGQTSGGTTKTDTVIITNDGTATLYIQSVTSTNTQFSVQSYPDSVLSQGDGMFILAFSPTDSGSQSGNIILVHSAATSPDTVEVLGIGTTTTVTFNYNARWNIVSNPLASPNDSVQYLFPNAINNRAFRFDGNSSGYISSMRLEQGRGYWAKFATGGTLQAIGLSSEQESVSVTSNWNLLGSLSEPLPVSKLTGLGTSLASLCYGYNAGYYVLDTILPGSGFWAKMSDSGTILLSNSSSQMNKTLVQRMSLVSKLNTLTIENSRHERQTLYFGMNPDDKSMVNENYFELPPSLEDDMFDVRFQTNTFAVFGEENSEREVPLVIHSQESPVTISWSVFKQRMNVSLLIDGKQQKLTASGKVTIQSGSSVRLQFSSTNESIPEVFALHQAFPNPFNPTTSIAFDLPENALVSVKIFDVLGREVAILANTESYEAGSHKLAFDGSGLPSGLYFYRISAQGEKNTFADVKRMLMVK